MKRKLILKGELADKFGEEHNINVKSAADAFKLLGANFPEFHDYIAKAVENNLYFAVEMQGERIDEETALLNNVPGDITVTPLPSGSDGAVGKIFAAFAIATFTFLTFGASAPLFAGKFAGATLFGGKLAVSTIGYSIAANIALSGVQELMAPDPSTDSGDPGPTSYIFTGSQQATVQGDPVPLLYGRLRVPGRPISIEIANGDFSQ